jgi:hypothetical protein
MIDGAAYHPCFVVVVVVVVVPRFIFLFLLFEGREGQCGCWVKVMNVMKGLTPICGALI